MWKLNSCWRAFWIFALQPYSDVRGYCQKQARLYNKTHDFSASRTKTKRESFLHSLKLGILIWRLQTWEKNVVSKEWSLEKAFRIHPINMVWSWQWEILSGHCLWISQAQTHLLKCGTETRVPTTRSRSQLYELPASPCSVHVPKFSVTMLPYM